MKQPFLFRLVAVCPSGHETKILVAKLDRADLSTLGAAESKIGDGALAKCVECAAACGRVRTYVDGTLVEELSLDEFERRAKDKAPPQNYG